MNKKVQEKLVSIIIPTYNRKNDLDKCITSILKQTFKNIQVVVIDDCSSDDTVEYINGKYPTVKLIINKANMGPNYCRNIGIINSLGNYLLFLDSDVVLIHSEQISEMVKIMNGNTAIGALGGIYEEPDPEVWGCNFDGTKIFVSDKNLLKECDFISSGNLFMRREELYYQQGFDEFVKGGGTEVEMGINLKRRGYLNLFGYSIAAKHNMSDIERDNIGLGLNKKYPEYKKQQLRSLYNFRNRLRYFFKNKFYIDGLKFLLSTMAINLISLLAFIKQQFFGFKNSESEKFDTINRKINVLIFKVRLVFDPFLWNITHLSETLKSRKINFLTNKKI